MQSISCTFIRIIASQNAGIGIESGMENAFVFTVHPYHCKHNLGEDVKKSGVLTCVGHVQDYPKGTPLQITYDETNYQEGTPLVVKHCIEHAIDYDATKTFLGKEILKSKDFVFVNHVANKTGKDLFRFAAQKNAVKILTPIVGEKTAVDAVTKLRTIIKKRRLIEKITEYGGTARQALKFYKEYGHDAMTLLKTNPYLLRFCDVRFSVYDKFPVDYTDPIILEKRVQAVLYEAIITSENAGNTFLSYHDLMCKGKWIASRENKKAPQITNFDLTASLARKKDLYICEKTEQKEAEKSQLNVYRKATWNEEKKTAAQVARLIGNAKACSFTHVEIQQIEQTLGIHYADEQKKAFSLLDKSGVAVLTGGPGTGKTTVVNGILRGYEAKFHSSKIALCAPTAAAAKRMKESTGKNALTIHKLLDIQPTGYGGYTSKNENNQLEHDLIIADEASMIDLSLFCMLVSAIKDGATLLMLGDKDQLSSVGYGNVLHDLMLCDTIKQTHLNKIFRQNEASSIVSNSKAIRDKNTNSIKQDQETEIILCNTESEMIEQTKSCMEKYFNPSDPFATRLLTPARNAKYVISTEQYNSIFQEVYNGNAKNTLRSGVNVWAKGDPVVFTRNNYAGGYFNGDTGVVVEVNGQDGGIEKLFVKTDDGTLMITGTDLYDVSLAYATTVHKSQGSECDYSIIVLPKDPGTLLRNDLVYVAATRAKKKNIFIVQKTDDAYGNTLKKAIHNTKQMNRKSGLVEKIKEKTEK